MKRGVIVENDNGSYFIYTHDETGLQVEFEITNINNFLETQEDLPTLVLELQKKVEFQEDLRTGIEYKSVMCNDKNTGKDISEEEIKYLGSAIFNNMRTIKKVREYLGWRPEPEIKKSNLKQNILKSKREMN